ncbi:ATP-dependent DNA helicase RecG [Candidatus Bandiella numerosa]|uniref:ATP-dependent DNA helicase RecG n=1 Tax=Candidatus Bandiella numerosa TaxID=2570586 RepID=UPI001F024649|nr:ATP-dependent DNA helicase RecG [Candidatus Bandiella numerosa]
MKCGLIRYLSKDISELMDVGDARVKLFAKLGIRKFKDLLFHLPTDYIDRRYSPNIYEIKNGDLVTLEVEVFEIKINTSFRHKSPSRILCKNESGLIELIYFNKIPPYIRQNFIAEKNIIISGKVEIQDRNFVMVHPDVVVKSNEKYKVPKLETVYPKVQGLTSKLISYLIRNILSNMPECEKWLPNDLLEKQKWKGFVESLNILHSPLDINSADLKNAKSRIAFDELLANQICLKILRQKLQNESKSSIKFSGKLVESFLDKLEFKLTKEQQLAVDSISQDQLAKKKMLRLLMGDVGCGKTFVAICAALNAIEAKKQVAFMVPTEILAQQHYRNIVNYTKQMEVKVELLVGSLKISERKEILKGLENGYIDLVVGTHTLFQEKVTFKNLGLVIIDEQHKFGVKQRLNLMQKGDDVDLLMLSATPIPRTINMLNYGDMDVSIIKQKPKSNVPIVTSTLSKSKMDNLIEKIEVLMKRGERVYWVCPLIEESEKLQLSYVENSFKILQEKLGDKVAMIHGKMKIEERDDAMQKFKNGQKLVLVSTTVIEVGVDVPEATVMVIENAERFGLSQLHQLRGRVGRGALQSYCILLYGTKLSLDSKKRLSILTSVSDGFEIAEKDLEIRGSGDYLGVRQSGESGFRFFDVCRDASLVSIADEYASELIKQPLGDSITTLLEVFDKDIYFKEQGTSLT